MCRRALGSSEVQHDRNDLTYTNDQEWTVVIEDEDPATMATRADSEMRLERPGWSVAAVGKLDLTADTDQFHVVVELTASMDGAEVFHRVWEESMPREWA